MHTRNHVGPQSASPVANYLHNDVWCGNSFLLEDTTNTAPSITWADCSSRCTANPACERFLWGYVRWSNVDVYRCALFNGCEQTQYDGDEDPQTYKKVTYTPTATTTAAPTATTTASPAGTIHAADMWCADANLIAGADTTNTEPTVTWADCAGRCTANPACLYFLWGVVTYSNVYPINRCALFSSCPVLSQTNYGGVNSDPNVYYKVTESPTQRCEIAPVSPLRCAWEHSAHCSAQTLTGQSQVTACADSAARAAEPYWGTWH